MQAGLLNDTIELIECVTTRDAFGAEVQTWQSHWKGRARVQFSSGKRFNDNGEIFNTTTRKITVRKQVGVDVKMRVIYNGQQYRIITIDSRRSDMSAILTCDLINE